MSWKDQELVSSLPERRKGINMNQLNKTNLLSKLFKKNWSNPVLGVPGKAPRVGDAGWMVDCKVTLFLKKVSLRQYLATIPFPVGLVGGGWFTTQVKKNF
jgi:hypothetical protein